MRKTIVFCLIAVAFLHLAFDSFAQISDQKNKHVLYLNSYRSGFFWSDNITDGVHKALSNKGIIVYTEFFDARRLPSNNNVFKSGLIQEKYKAIKFDAVLTSDYDALDFAIAHGDELFPEIPVLFCGINNPQDYDFENTRFYGFLENTTPAKGLDLISQIFPGTIHGITRKSIGCIKEQDLKQRCGTHIEKDMVAVFRI